MDEITRAVRNRPHRKLGNQVEVVWKGDHCTRKKGQVETLTLNQHVKQWIEAGLCEEVKAKATEDATPPPLPPRNRKAKVTSKK